MEADTKKADAGNSTPDNPQKDTAPDTGNVTPKSAADTSSTVILAASVVIITVYFAVLLFMLGSQLGVSDVSWSRAIYLLSGFEAVAFTATGYLFGREVNRKRAEQAEGQAASAQQQAVKAEKVATEQTVKGRTLVQAINLKARSTASQMAAGAPGQLESLDPNATPPPPPRAVSDIQDLADLANQLF